MKQTDYEQQSYDYQRIERAIRFLEDNFRSQPSLDHVARSVHLSKYHFERMFKRWAGVSPMQFLRFLTLDYTKQRLRDSTSILDAAYDAGLSGPGRLHDLFVNFDAMTPGEYKKQGAGMSIRYGFNPTPFGECLLALTDKGICHLGFLQDHERGDALDQLRQNWPGATFSRDPVQPRELVTRIFQVDSKPSAQPFHLHLKGTNFQINVWRALLRIPPGSVVSYQDVAIYLGRPTALRAAANAIALNPVAYLIPCHRVIAKSGRFNQYRWGTARKKAIVFREAAAAM